MPDSKDEIMENIFNATVEPIYIPMLRIPTDGKIILHLEIASYAYFFSDLGIVTFISISGDYWREKIGKACIEYDDLDIGEWITLVQLYDRDFESMLLHLRLLISFHHSSMMISRY
jgi:hypothetical protein